MPEPDVDALYRCGGCNYKFPAEMAGRRDGKRVCPKCDETIERFASYEEGGAYEFIAHTAHDRYSFQGESD